MKSLCSSFDDFKVDVAGDCSLVLHNSKALSVSLTDPDDQRPQ